MNPQTWKCILVNDLYTLIPLSCREEEEEEEEESMEEEGTDESSPEKPKKKTKKVGQSQLYTLFHLNRGPDIMHFLYTFPSHRVVNVNALEKHLTLLLKLM